MKIATQNKLFHEFLIKDISTLQYPEIINNYQVSWSWIMPVWIKFKNLNLEEPNYTAWVDSLANYLLRSDTPNGFTERLAYAIDWHNKNKEEKKIEITEILYKGEKVGVFFDKQLGIKVNNFLNNNK